MAIANTAGTWSATVWDSHWLDIYQWLDDTGITVYTVVGHKAGRWPGPYSRTYTFCRLEDFVQFCLAWNEILINDLD